MICDKFVHIHIPRTGGSLLRSIVQELMIAPRRLEMINVDAHKTLRDSRKLSKAPAFTFIRNPFDWYVSKYHRLIDQEKIVGTFEDYFCERILGGRTLTFFWNWYTFPKIDEIGRFENLENEIVRILGKYVPELEEEEIREKIYALGKVRASKDRNPYQEYYTDEMISVIYRADAWILDTFGYDYEKVFD